MRLASTGHRDLRPALRLGVAGAFQKEDLYEYACHEGNYSLRAMLSGMRAAERAGR